MADKKESPYSINICQEKVNYKLIPELPVSKTQFLNPFCWYKIISKVKKEKITHLILEHPYHGIAGWLAKKIYGVKLIVHSHNIEAQRFKETGNRWWRLLAVYEKWVHRQANLNLFKTEEELRYAVAHFDLDKEKCLLVPYGIDPEEKRPDRDTARSIIAERHNILSTEKILLFAGTLDYKPNATAVENIYKEIAPRLAVKNFQGKIIICGRNKLPAFQYLNSLSHPMVINAGEVEDIENYFAAADVFINPVVSGGGIQTKVIDALSYGCGVICFEKKIAGIHVSLIKERIFLCKADSWDEFIFPVTAGCKTNNNIPSDFIDHFNFQEIAAAVSKRIRNL
jgi:polysaccharide biosynthesis protein PslH